ncbi:MAG TPA: hypothetical protein VME66_15740 [Candidatus Acidoferrales bacterium]|nr:hypothetical protein [Candidatus Acidoferrales bacterium]
MVDIVPLAPGAGVADELGAAVAAAEETGVGFDPGGTGPLMPLQAARAAIIGMNATAIARSHAKRACATLPNPPKKRQFTPQSYIDCSKDISFD